MRRFLLPAILLFTLALNHAAFLNWFHDDDLDNLSWGPVEDLSGYAKRLVSPLFYRDTFRPTGHIMYHVLGNAARLNYAWYEGWLLAGHLLNIALLWRLLSKLGLAEVPAAIGTMFFAFHQACFFAYWRPMYVFDVYCTTFSLLAILAYMADRWIVSFAMFWIAYRAKELAIMVPVALAAWDILEDPRRFISTRRWLRLVPFFAVSASFGLQAIHASRATNDPYTIRASPLAVWEGLKFYASALLLFPYSGFALLAAPALFRKDRRVWLGIILFFAFLAPMLAFPDRRYSVYLYLPLTGAAMVIAAVVAARPRIEKPALALLAVWIAVCCASLLRFESVELADAADRRTIARSLQTSVIQHPGINYWVYENLPKPFAPWGVTGALSFYTRQYTGKRPDLQFDWAGILKLDEFATKIPAAQFSWDPQKRTATILHHTAESRDWPYLTLGPGAPIWQLGAGFSPTHEGGFRWIPDHAEARLWRPADARFFELVVNAGDLVYRRKKDCAITVKLGDIAMEPRRVPDLQDHRLRWDLPPLPAADAAAGGRSVPVSIDVDAWFQPDGDTRKLSIHVIAMGFQ